MRDDELPASDRAALRSDGLVTPHPKRLSPNHLRRSEILARHEAACATGVPTYVDPDSGFSVFTAAFLAARGYCCESGCRHCPFVID